MNAHAASKSSADQASRQLQGSGVEGQVSSRPVSRAHARRSCLVGRPMPGSRTAAGEGSGADTAGGGDKSSYRACIASAPPRRSAKPTTLRSRTRRSRATVSTSPGLTAWLAASTRTPLTRTCPDTARAAAALRVRTTRAYHSHLSMRWRVAATAQLKAVGFIAAGYWQP
jgi:hypothetical protein